MSEPWEPTDFESWNQQTLSFTGTWSLVDPITGALSPMGWTSDGTLSDSGDMPTRYSPGGSFDGTLTMTTYTTPEPASITLLGLGMVAVGFLRRRRLTNSSHR
jgi:hypothetical protein